MKPVYTALIGLLLYTVPAASLADPETHSFINATYELLQKQDYDGLEKQAAELREKDEHFSNSNSKIRTFYSLLAAYKTRDCACNEFAGDERTYDQAEQPLQQWLKAKPDSITPRIALAELAKNAAWDARGEGFISTVSAAQEAEFERWLSKEAGYLKGIDAQNDPYLFDLRMGIAKNAGLGKEKLRALFDIATRLFPHYYHFYADRAVALQPRWYGAPGELGHYMKALLTTSPGGDAGKIAYTYASARLYSMIEKEVFTDRFADWKTLKDAYATRGKVYSLQSRDWNLLMKMAADNNDAQAARYAYKHIGDDWNKAIWGKKAEFDTIVAWIAQESP